MKIGKRVQSLITAVACLCVWCAVIIPAAPVSAAKNEFLTIDENGYTQDFDSLNEENNLSTLYGWDGKGLTTSTEATVVDEGDVHKKAIKLTSTASRPVLRLTDGVNPTYLEGRYEIQFAVKTGTAKNARIDFMTSGTYDDNNVLFSANDSDIILSTGNTTSRRFRVAENKVNQWYIVTALVDTDLQYYSVKIYEENEAGEKGALVASRGGMPFMDIDVDGNPGHIHMLRFRTDNNGDVTFDNVSVKPTTEAPDSVILDDNFDSYTNFATAAGNEDVSPYFHRWAMRSGAYPNVVDDPRGSGKSIETGRPSSIQDLVFLCGENTTTEYKNTTYRTGTLRLTAFWCATSEATDKGMTVLFVPTNFAYTAGDGFPAVTALGGTFYVNHKGKSDAKAFGTYTPGKWYQFVITLNLDTQKFDVQVLHEGTVIAQVRDRVTLGGQQTGAGAANSNMTLSNVKAITFNNQIGALNYVDDVKLEYLGKAADSDYIMIEDDFANMTDDTAADYGWTLGNGSVNGDGTIKLGTGSSARTSNRFTNVKTGKYKISMDLNWNAATGWGVFELMTGKGGDGIPLLTYNGNTLYHRGTAGTGGGVSFGTFEAEKWYTFECTLDLNNETLDYNMKDADGNVLIDNVHDSKIYIGGAEVSVATLQYIHSIRMIASNGVNMRNFSIIDYEPVPTLTANNVSMIDWADNTIQGIAEPVTPAIKQIILDFNCDAVESSLDGITLTNAATGIAIGYSGEKAGNTYVMTLSAMLERNTKYQISVPGTVSNFRGQTIDGSKTLEFTTGSTASIVKTNGVKRGTDEITKVSDLKANDKITVETTAINAGDAGISLIWIAAYYSGDSMVYTEISEPVTLAANGTSVEPPIFTVPDGETFSGVDEISFYLWDGINTLVPWCKALTLTQQ